MTIKDDEPQAIDAADPDTLLEYALAIEEIRYNLDKSNQAGFDELARLSFQLAVDALSTAALQLKFSSAYQSRRSAPLAR